MRQSLLKSFDKIFILNLHGNRKQKKEPDENIFDIERVGVAIGIFIKDGSKKGEYAEVYYYSTLEDESLLTRNEKFDFLEKNSISSIKWHKLHPESPFYFFKPIKVSDIYETFWGLEKIFQKNTSGIITSRDKLVIGFTPKEVEEKIKFFLENSPEVIRNKFFSNLRGGKYPPGDTREWKLEKAQEKLKKILKIENLKDYIYPILYRPFDIRFIFYHELMVDWGRWELMSHMLKGKNFGLIAARTDKVGEGNSIFITKYLSEAKTGESSTQSYLFPLYLYTPHGKQPNFTPKFRKFIKNLYGKEPSPEEILYYIYAILYSPTYREKYREQLKYNFPKIPFTGDYEKFKKLSELGEKLVKLHLLEDESLKTPSVKFRGKGTNEVERISKKSYDYKNKRVYINKNQYFEPVSKEVWNYKIGGYQVLKKWLSYRRGRKLTLEEIETFMKIVKALEETLKLQKEINRETDFV